MKKFISKMQLSKEAVLFDSKLYIIKSVLAIATGYLIGKAMPIARIDMISVLLGVMYNLQPTNISGVKSCIEQLEASTLGAACTSILIALFGINVFTVGISMALTIYVSLKINWKMVSPVAIFTCIYMTQNIQKDAFGHPSIWLTFRLRIVALGLGVLIAVIYNYISSFFYYRKMAYKRLQYAKLQLLSGLEYTKEQLESNGKGGREYLTLFPGVFNDMDLVYTNVDAMIKESKYFFNLLNLDKLKSIQKILKYFRDINHLAYDVNFEICRDNGSKTSNENAVKQISEIIEIIKGIDYTLEDVNVNNLNIEINKEEFDINDRIQYNLSLINDSVKLVIEESKVLFAE